MSFSRTEQEDITKLTNADPHFHLVIMAKSDNYPAAHFRASILLSFCASMTLYFIPWDFYDPIWYLYIQIPALVLGYIFASSKRLKRLFTTSSEMREEVYQKALEVFHRLEDRTESSKLLYISVLERRVELISLKDLDQEESKAFIKSVTKSISKLGLYEALKKELPAIIKIAQPLEPIKEEAPTPQVTEE